MKKPALLERRPAETGTPIAMAVAYLLARILGVEDIDTIGYMAIVIAFVPAAITWLVSRREK